MNAAQSSFGDIDAVVHYAAGSGGSFLHNAIWQADDSGAPSLVVEAGVRGDFHLGCGSNALDLEGNGRPFGGDWDVGALELVAECN